MKGFREASNALSSRAWSSLQRSASARRAADAFLTDLLGTRAAPRSEANDEGVEASDEASDEAVPSGGRGSFRHAPLGGAAGDNVQVRWNVDAATAAGATIAIVVHLHGYGDPRADFIAHKASVAGVDLVDAAGTIRVRATTPTLVLVPRGVHGNDAVWTFDTVLPDNAALSALIDAGLEYLARHVLAIPSPGALRRGRLTLMAHSGGGAGINHLLTNQADPDEVVCFDSMYGDHGPIRRWAERRIASTTAASSGLRVFYTGCSGPSAAHPAGQWVVPPQGGRAVYHAPGSWVYRSGSWRLITTEVQARRLKHHVDAALAALPTGATLAPRFRVERTSVAHNDIPARYTAALLDDIAANVPSSSAAPASSVRPSCVANNDWLTATPVKAYGADPPPPRPADAP